MAFSLINAISNIKLQHDYKLLYMTSVDKHIAADKHIAEEDVDQSDLMQKKILKILAFFIHLFFCFLSGYN